MNAQTQVLIRSIGYSNGIDLSNNTFIFKYPGTYLIEFNTELFNSKPLNQIGIITANFWFKYNNAVINNSGFKQTSAIGNEQITPTIYIVQRVNVNDSISIFWSVSDIALYMNQSPIGTNPAFVTSNKVIIRQLDSYDNIG